MKNLTNFLDHFPVATAVHLLVAIVGAVLLIAHNQLPEDFGLYAGIVEGGNGLVAIGRGLTKRPRS